MAKCDYITDKTKEGEDSIWGEVYHTVEEEDGRCCGPCACHRVRVRSVNHHCHQRHLAGSALVPFPRPVT